MNDKPTFLRFKRGGKVHVMEGLSDISQILGTEPSPATALMASQVAICGARGTPGQLHGVSKFNDGDLCWKCRNGWIGDKCDLFQHEQIAQGRLRALVITESCLAEAEALIAAARKESAK